jgi:ATP-dependent helicase/nuclease subunit A
VAQFRVLERLLRGWENSDGRSLFLVGDPMQSIYRFRQAEVGLFLRACRDGIGDVVLLPLYLTQNFRSSAKLIEWTNHTFAQAFAAADGATEGAVDYTGSVASIEDSESQVKVHPFRDWSQEAQRVVEIIQHCQRCHPDRNIAVLVRSRAHLVPLYPLLQQHAIAYQAVGIEFLLDRTVVRDLLSLARALLHPADTIAWLAILRAPWCGLIMADLLALAEQSDLVSSTALGETGIEAVSADGSRRLRRFQLALQPVISLAGRVPWARTVKSAWLALGGPACVTHIIDLSAAEDFFDELTAVQDDSGALSIADLQERLEKRPAAVENPGDTNLQLMTIHKAKGLEFDTVIVPNLGRYGRPDEPLPIRWLQSNDGQLLLAPAKRPDELEADAIYQLIGTVEKEKADNELKRLLYVAVTRAKSELHLLGHAVASGGDLRCDKRSLLQVIWPQAEAQFEVLKADAGIQAQDLPATAVASPAPLRRLPVDWQMPPLREAVDGGERSVGRPSQPDVGVEFDWAGQTARCVGTVVHQYLQRFADQGLDHWSPARIVSAGAGIGVALLESGLAKDEIAQSVQRCQLALSNALDDPRGRWLLGPREFAASEFAISGLVDEEVDRLIIDRTFVDENNTRWIVDYKTGEHLGADIEHFLDREQSRYRQQLQVYADLMQHIDARPIRLGLYFPMLRGWREWAA